MHPMVQGAAVRVVKPLLPESAWSSLRQRFVAAPAPRPTTPLTPAQQRRRELRRMDLTELARHFGTDKAGRHHYTQHYERHLAHLRREQFTLLEIGIGGYRRQKKGGASLRMWRNWFPRATIVGLDIQDKSFIDAKRVRIYQGSQTDEEVLHRIVSESGGLKVVVDDGSHRPADIRESFRILFPLIDDDGIYVIEDTQTSYWPSWAGSTDLHDPHTTMALVKDLLDGLNYEEFEVPHEPSYTDRHVVGVHAYHNLVIIEKGRNDEGSTRGRR
jgi:demethylmacrocin O-methyltransferase